MTAENDDLIPRQVVGITAFVCAVTLVLIALLGPAMLNVIHYRTSLSGIWQTEAFDITNLIVLVPILITGEILDFLKKDGSKYFLILSPIMLMYSGLEYGIGQEWGNPAYVGNSEAFCGLFLLLTVGGLILLIGTLTRFTSKDAPIFNPKVLRIYVGIMSVFLLMFAFMWVSQVAQVISTGNTLTGDYLATPTSWWMVKFMDLGITIPVGFLSLLLLLSKPKKAYPLLLLFFGFFITLATAVNASAVIEVINRDPTVTIGSGTTGIVIFPVLAILAYAGLFYLIRTKLPSRTHLWRAKTNDEKETDTVGKSKRRDIIVVYRSKYGTTKRYAKWI